MPAVAPIVAYAGGALFLRQTSGTHGYAQYFIPSHPAERHELLICHGNILRYFVCRALQVPGEAWIHSDVHNCGISEIGSDGRVMLVSHNDTGHLPYPMRTYTSCSGPRRLTS